MGWFWRIGLLRSRIKDSSRAVVAGKQELLHVLYYTKTEALRKGVGTVGMGCWVSSATAQRSGYLHMLCYAVSCPSTTATRDINAPQRHHDNACVTTKTCSNV